MENFPVRMPSRRNAGILRSVQRAIADEQVAPEGQVSTQLVEKICGLSHQANQEGNASLSGSIMTNLTNSLDGLG